MATHIRPTTPPPTRIRVATANATASGQTTAAASSHDRWGAALAASGINGDGHPMFGAYAVN
jgi:hypothetical protein